MIDIVREAGFVAIAIGQRYDVLADADGEAAARPFGPSGLTFAAKRPA